MKKLIAAAFSLASATLMGQDVLGVGNFIHVAKNLDRSIEFYRDGLGLEMTGAPGPRAFSANAVVSGLYDAPGAQSRVASFKIPGSDMAVEIVEFQGLNATPVSPRFFDPGAITLNLPVEDFDAVKDRLTRMKGLEFVSASRSSTVTVRDPDGIFVTVVNAHRPVPAGVSPQPVAPAKLIVTVENRDRSAQFYQQALGFAPVGLSQPDYADRKAVHSAIHDPGSSVQRLRVGDFDATLKAAMAAGSTVVSADGKPVNLGRNRAVILQGPDNLFLQLLESPPAPGASPTAK